LHASLEGSQSLHLVCLHLDLLERGRQQQMVRLIERVRASVPDGAPLIVAGDFNDWRQKVSDPLSDSLGLKESGVEFAGEHAKTFPSWRPFLALDRVYVRGLKICDYKVLSGNPWKRMSDHAAVMVELEISAAE
jgi:endonuclease/exonuclease/phosphatase family metal-dependent hydrolase